MYPLVYGRKKAMQPYIADIVITKENNLRISEGALVVDVKKETVLRNILLV